MIAIGWILRRDASGNCIFYSGNSCSIYEWRPLICSCYPFFIDGAVVEVMQCGGLHRRMTARRAELMGWLLRRYEIKKLQSYINIVRQLGSRLDIASLRVITGDYPDKVIVCDGERHASHQVNTAGSSRRFAHKDGCE